MPSSVSCQESAPQGVLQAFVLPFDRAVGLLVIYWCVAGLGAHGLLELFPEFTGERSPLIGDDLCWQAEVLLPPMDEGLGA